MNLPRVTGFCAVLMIASVCSPAWADDPLIKPVKPAKDAESHKYEKAGETFKTGNGISATLVHGGFLKRDGGRHQSREAAVRYELDGHPPQFSSGMGHHYVFGRPVTVKFARGKGVFGSTGTVEISFGPSAPRFSTSIDEQVKHVLELARKKGFPKPVAYTWSPSFAQGELSLKLKLSEKEGLEATLNQVTGETAFREVKYTAMGGFVQGMPGESSYSIPAFTEVDVKAPRGAAYGKVLLKASVFRACLNQVAANTAYRLKYDGKAMRAVHVDGSKLLDHDVKCLEALGGSIEHDGPFKVVIRKSVSTGNFYPPLPRTPRWEVKARGELGPGAAKALDAQSSRLKHCFASASYEPVAKPVTVEIPVTPVDGRANRISPQVSKQPFGGCLRFVLQRGVEFPPGTPSLTVTFTY